MIIRSYFYTHFKGFPQDDMKVKLYPGCQLFAYQLPLSYPIAAALQRYNMLSSPYSVPSSSNGMPPALMTSSSRSSSSSSIRCNSFAPKPTPQSVTANANGTSSLSVATGGIVSAAEGNPPFLLDPCHPQGDGPKDQRCFQNGPLHFQNHHHHNLVSGPQGSTCLSRIQRSHLNQGEVVNLLLFIILLIYSVIKKRPSKMLTE